MRRRHRAASDVSLEITVISDHWQQVPGATDLCREAAMETLRHLGAGRRLVELSVVLADDEAVRELNLRYRQQDKPTNVLSFPGQDAGLAACRGTPDMPPVILGDVILAAGTVIAEAGSQGKPVSDHLRHLVVHGVLHLLGFEHETDDEAERMEAVEKAVLGELGVPDPYAADAVPARA